MKIKRHLADEMTPVERRKAIEEGKPYDRIPCLPCMGEFKCQISKVSIREMWHDAQKMADTEIASYNRFGHEQLMIGPNSYGIAEMLGAYVEYPENQLPYVRKLYLDELEKVDELGQIEIKEHPRMRVFTDAACILEKEALKTVPVSASAGGPLTIASYLHGAEKLLRDFRKNPKKVHQLLRVITDAEKSSIKIMAEFGLGAAFADPVANPELIGPKYYREFAFPYMKELTDYAYKISGKKPFLHMCGKTYPIWKYFRELQLESISIDNIIDLNRAREELSDVLTVAGNVPPVDVVMDGTKEEIYESVKQCMDIGKQMEKGYVLATGCEVPYGTEPEKVDWFMEAGRLYGKK